MSDYVPTSTYVPTTDEVETGFHEFASWLETKYPGEYEQAPEFADWREAMHGFRRWLAEVRRQAAEEALLKAADAVSELIDGYESTADELRGRSEWVDSNRYSNYAAGLSMAAGSIRKLAALDTGKETGE